MVVQVSQVGHVSDVTYNFYLNTFITFRPTAPLIPPPPWTLLPQRFGLPNKCQHN